MEGGLVKHDGKKVVKRYQAVKDDPTSISSDHIIRVEEKGDYLWVGTVEGINRLDKQTDKFKRYLTRVKCSYLLKDKSGDLWAGTTAGLFRYDSISDSFKPAGYHSVIATENIFAMVEDAHRNLWISTPSDIVRIDSSRKVVTQLGAPNGISHGSDSRRV